MAQQPPQQPQYPPQQYAPPPPPQPVVVQKRGGCLRNILIVVGIIIVIGIVAAVVAPKGNTTTSSSSSSAPAATATLAPLAPAYSEIAAKKASMTDAQWDEYAKTLKGNRIENWSGTVLDVGPRALSDNYNIQVDLDGKGGSLNVAEALVETTKDEALKVSKGTAITFSGTVDSVSCLLTYCPVQVVKATYTVK
jgi:hypothetical protein